MSAEPRETEFRSSDADLALCARWRRSIGLEGNMLLCVCRRPNLGGWDECPVEARGIIGRQAPVVESGLGADPAAQGFTGDACDLCGNFRLVRTGTCATCLDCGSTGGCG